RDNRERLAIYARADIEVRRIALTVDQVRQYNPPPNFAKESDTRYDSYVAQFGTTECWELDALDPTVIAELIRSELDGVIDQDPWREAISREEENRGMLTRVSENWTKVKKLISEAKRP